MRGPWRVRRASSLAVLATIALLTACAPAVQAEPEPRPLSGSEAELLAVVRFRNFDAGTRSIETRIPGTQAGDLRLSGWFDYAARVGYVSTSTQRGSAGLTWWNESTVAVREDPVEAAPLPPPADGWESGPLDPSGTTLAAALALIGGLGADRPENPQLLAQSDAAWLRTDEVHGIEVDVFAGPSGDQGVAADVEDRPRYWVDESGILWRLQVRLGGADEWTVIDLGDGGGLTLPIENPATEPAEAPAG